MDYDKEIRAPGLGGINVDIIDTKLLPNDTRILRNARRFDGADGRDGSVRNILGNLKISYQGDGEYSDDAEVIGTAKDQEVSGIIIFIADPHPNFRDQIIEYIPETGEVIKLLFDTSDFKLDFSTIFRIRGAFVIDGLLYWNDGRLRKLNVRKIRAGEAYTTINEQTVSLIKYPPADIIRPYYFTDINNSMNRMRGLLFQFRYQYIYEDNEVSVASVISGVAVPIGEVDYSGEVVGNLQKNNAIKFSVNTGHSTVKKITIYVRVGNTGTWGSVETIDKDELGLDSNVLYTYTFYNDRVIEAVDQEIINTLFHAVPLKSDMIGYLHTNEVLLTGFTEGYDNLTDMDVRLNPISQEIPAIIKGDLVRTYSHSDLWFYEKDLFWVPTPDSPYRFYIHAGQIVEIGEANLPAVGSIISITVGDQTLEFISGNDDSVDMPSFRDRIVSLINSEMDGLRAVTERDPSWNYIIPLYEIPEDSIFVSRQQILYSSSTPPSISGGDIDFPNILIEVFDIDEGSYRAYSCFKSGSEQQFGLLYSEDAGRESFVQKAQKIYLPCFTEEGAVIPEGSEGKQNLVYFIDWEIFHRPPDWATRFQWCRQINLSLTYFQRYIIAGIYHGVGNDPDPDSVDSDKSSIDITPLNKHKVQFNGLDYSFPNSSITPYVFQKGDRVRFITQAKTEFERDPGLGDLVTFHLDMEILEYQVIAPDVEGEGTADAEASNVLIVQLVPLQYRDELGENTLIEIYRPRREQEELIYYEMSDVYKVIDDPDNPGRKIHMGNTRNQTWGTEEYDDLLPARGRFYFGDAYMVPTLFTKKLSENVDLNHETMLEGMSASNYYDLQVYNIGRPNITDNTAKQKKYLSLRSSEKYFEGTKINGLSEFYGGSDLQLSAEFGDTITGLIEVGFSLKVLQERKMTTFFVGRTGLQLASGQDTDQIQAESSGVSTKSPAKESRGCSNFESVLAVNRQLFFVDIKNGVIVRDAANGPFDIDRYGVQKEIKRICHDLLTNYTTNRIIASHNPITNEVGFSFIGWNKNGEKDFGTHYFKYEENKWSSIWDYGLQSSMPVEWASINQSLVSFIGTTIWLHETNQVRNNLYGQQLPMSIEMIFNKPGTKLFKWVEIYGSGEWSCPEEGDVMIEAKNAVTEKLQLSRIVPGRFENVKGKKVAYLLKDMNTQNGINKLKNLRTGKDLKGSVLFIRLVNTETQEAIIDTVAVGYQNLRLP